MFPKPSSFLLLVSQTAPHPNSCHWLRILRVFKNIWISSRKNNISQHILCLLLSRFGPQRPSRLKYQVNNDPKQNLSSSLKSFNCWSPLPFFILLQLCYHFFSWLLIKNRFSPCRRLLEYDRISDGAHINGSGVSYRAECHPHKDDWPCYSQPLRVVGEQLWANERALTRASLIEVYMCKKINVKQFWIITQKVLKTKSCILMQLWYKNEFILEK